MTNAQGGWAAVAVSAIALTLAAVTASAQSFKTLLNFNGANGANPYYMSLVQGFDGNFYGTTAGGGTAGRGTVFKIDAQGALATLYNFCSRAGCADGSSPYGTLVEAPDGSFFGTTAAGGSNNAGTVFRITLRGVLTTLHSFTGGEDGSNPSGGLAEAPDGNFYGTTPLGGANSAGTIFKLTPNGTLATVYSFCARAGCPDGNEPIASLVLAADGNFYGTTYQGGTQRFLCSGRSGCGTVFKIAPGGSLTTLHSFDSGDGASPEAALVQAADGDFYGTTAYGGSDHPWCADGCGTVFKITTAGVLTVLHTFSYTDGAIPVGALIQGTDGNLYGTTSQGGGSGCCGTVFQVGGSGALTTLHSFNSTDGSNPYGAVLQATDGNFYGTTSEGGANRLDGTIFGLSLGLAPFLQTQPSQGSVGGAVKILGSGLGQSTAVTFNSVPSTFTVVSASLISTTVPPCATTGPVKVVTPSGTLTSNISFQVLP
jgi:uncharacterized repeat protein (TIGR03803 family)